MYDNYTNYCLNVSLGLPRYRKSCQIRSFKVEMNFPLIPIDIIKLTDAMTTSDYKEVFSFTNYKVS